MSCSTMALGACSERSAVSPLIPIVANDVGEVCTSCLTISKGRDSIRVTGRNVTCDGDAFRFTSFHDLPRYL